MFGQSSSRRSEHKNFFATWRIGMLRWWLLTASYSVRNDLFRLNADRAPQLKAV